MNYDDRSANAGNGATSAFLMFSAGALVGAAAALILAPASGREARQYLGQRGKKLAENVAERGKQVADNVAEQGRRVWDEHGERVAQAVRDGFAHATEATAERANRAADSGNPM